SISFAMPFRAELLGGSSLGLRGSGR
ncbi:hypothetical protein A2U01_0057065, partial [Trifolium medium]|nr:hypothetical protein [Trifolium medium]